MKSVVITGASKGIGYALAKAFLEHDNHRVIGIARSAKELERLLDSGLPGEFIPILADLSRDDHMQSILERIKATAPRVDVLVNNAGLLINKPFKEIRADELDMMYTLHLRVPFQLIQGLLPLMTEGTHIVNISSMGGFQGSVKFPSLSGYSATKGSLSILTEALAVELGDLGIGINCLAIGAVQTEMLAAAFPGYSAPLNPDEFAQFVMNFCLEGHRFFQGKILPVSVSTP